MTQEVSRSLRATSAPRSTLRSPPPRRSSSCTTARTSRSRTRTTSAAQARPLPSLAQQGPLRRTSTSSRRRALRPSVRRHCPSRGSPAPLHRCLRLHLFLHRATSRRSPTSAAPLSLTSTSRRLPRSRTPRPPRPSTRARTRRRTGRTRRTTARARGTRPSTRHSLRRPRCRARIRARRRTRLGRRRRSTTRPEGPMRPLLILACRLLPLISARGTSLICSIAVPVDTLGPLPPSETRKSGRLPCRRFACLSRRDAVGWQLVV